MVVPEKPEVGESLVRCLLVVRLLQLLQDSQVIARHACNGSGDCRSRVGYRRVASVGVRLLPEPPKSILELPRTNGLPTASRDVTDSRSPHSGPLPVQANIGILVW
jgi:hypothetical protein